MGSGWAVRVWGKYFILPDSFRFEEMKSVDRPLCGRIDCVVGSDGSGGERSGDRVYRVENGLVIGY